MSAPHEERIRLPNSQILASTARIIDDHAEEWGVNKGEVIDRLVKMAVGTQAAERQAEAGLGALEEMTRRVLGDYTLTITEQLKQLLEGPHIEASTARLLLFALLAAWKGPHAAALNEDHAVRIARQARVDGRFPQMPRPSTDEAETPPVRPQRWPASPPVTAHYDTASAEVAAPARRRRWFGWLTATTKGEV
jgi:hypothetical protein